MIITYRLVNISVIMMWILSFSLSVLIAVLPVMTEERSHMMNRFSTDNGSNMANIAQNNTMLTYKDKHGYNNTLSTYTEEYGRSNTLLTHTEKYANPVNEVNILAENTSHSITDGFDFRHSDLRALLNRLDSSNSTDVTFCEQMVLGYSFIDVIYRMSFLGVLLCIILLIFVYSRICCEISALSRRSQEMTGHSLRQRKTTVTTFLIVFSFVICWFPGPMLYFAVGGYLIDPGNLFLLRTIFILQLVNTIIDPFLYALRLPEVRVCYGKLKARCCRLR